MCHLHERRYGCEDKTRIKCCSARKDCERIYYAFAFACVVGKNPKTPKLSPMAEDAITQGGIGSLVSLVYICGYMRLSQEESGCIVFTFISFTKIAKFTTFSENFPKFPTILVKTFCMLLIFLEI